MLIINLGILLLFPPSFLKPWETSPYQRTFGAYQQDTWKGVTRDGREHRGIREKWQWHKLKPQVYTLIPPPPQGLCCDFAMNSDTCIFFLVFKKEWVIIWGSLGNLIEKTNLHYNLTFFGIPMRFNFMLPFLLIKCVLQQFHMWTQCILSTLAPSSTEVPSSPGNPPPPYELPAPLNLCYLTSELNSALVKTHTWIFLNHLSHPTERYEPFTFSSPHWKVGI